MNIKELFDSKDRIYIGDRVFHWDETFEMSYCGPLTNQFDYDDYTGFDNKFTYRYYISKDNIGNNKINYTILLIQSKTNSEKCAMQIRVGLNNNDDIYQYDLTSMIRDTILYKQLKIEDIISETFNISKEIVLTNLIEEIINHDVHLVGRIVRDNANKLGLNYEYGL